MEPYNLDLVPTLQDEGMPEEYQQFPDLFLPGNHAFGFFDADLATQHMAHDLAGQVSRVQDEAEGSIVRTNASIEGNGFSFAPTAVNAGALADLNGQDHNGSNHTSPAKSRKRKAPTMRDEEFEPYRARITELYKDLNYSLQDTMNTIYEERQFKAEKRQYQSRIKKWRLDKNVKPNEMKTIVRKQQERKIDHPEKRGLRFEVRNYTVPQPKIDRWMQKENVNPNSLYDPRLSSSTASDIFCRTLSVAESHRSRLSGMSIDHYDRTSIASGAIDSNTQVPLTSEALSQMSQMSTSSTLFPTEHGSRSPQFPSFDIVSSQGNGKSNLDLTTALLEIGKIIGCGTESPREYMAPRGAIPRALEADPLLITYYLNDEIAASMLELENQLGDLGVPVLHSQGPGQPAIGPAANNQMASRNDGFGFSNAAVLYGNLLSLTLDFESVQGEGYDEFEKMSIKESFLGQMANHLLGSQTWLQKAIQEAIGSLRSADHDILWYKYEIAAAYLIQELLRRVQRDLEINLQRCRGLGHRRDSVLDVERGLAHLYHLQGRRTCAERLLLDIIKRRLDDDHDLADCTGLEKDINQLYFVLAAQESTAEQTEDRLICLLGTRLGAWSWEDEKTWTILKRLVSIESPNFRQPQGDLQRQDRAERLVHQYVSLRCSPRGPYDIVSECCRLIHSLSTRFVRGQMFEQENRIVVPAIFKAFKTLAASQPNGSGDILRMLKQGCQHHDMPLLALTWAQETIGSPDSGIGTFTSAELLPDEVHGDPSLIHDTASLMWQGE